MWCVYVFFFSSYIVYLKWTTRCQTVFHSIYFARCVCVFSFFSFIDSVKPKWTQFDAKITHILWISLIDFLFSLLFLLLRNFSFVFFGGFFFVCFFFDVVFRVFFFFVFYSFFFWIWISTRHCFRTMALNRPLARKCSTYYCGNTRKNSHK